MDRKVLLATAIVAACTFTAAPAAGQHSSINDRQRSAEKTLTVADAFSRCSTQDGVRHQGSRGGSIACRSFNDGFAYADGEWALYNNRSWEPDSYNDWWHDRPDRAFPRWVLEQRARGTCESGRRWWSGGGWHC